MKQETKEEFMLAVSLIAILVFVLAFMKCNIGCGQALSVQPSQLDKIKAAVEGYGNTLSIHTSKLQDIETNQNSIGADVEEMKGDIINNNIINNPWPYVIICGIIVIGAIALIGFIVWTYKSPRVKLWGVKE